METRNIFLNISPLDHRYSLSEAKMYEKLSERISEQAAVISCARAEIALVKAHLATRGDLTASLEAELDKVADTIDPSLVYAEEENVITSYSIHYTKLYENTRSRYLTVTVATLLLEARAATFFFVAVVAAFAWARPTMAK